MSLLTPSYGDLRRSQLCPSPKSSTASLLHAEHALGISAVDGLLLRSFVNPPPSPPSVNKADYVDGNATAAVRLQSLHSADVAMRAGVYARRRYLFFFSFSTPPLPRRHPRASSKSDGPSSLCGRWAYAQCRSWKRGGATSPQSCVTHKLAVDEPRRRRAPTGGCGMLSPCTSPAVPRLNAPRRRRAAATGSRRQRSCARRARAHS